MRRAASGYLRSATTRGRRAALLPTRPRRRPRHAARTRDKPVIVRRTTSPQPPRQSARRPSRSAPRDQLEIADVHGAHLDSPGRSRRAAGSPIERGIERLEVHDRNAPELILGLGEWPVLDMAEATFGPDGRGGAGSLERRAGDVGARL